MVSLTKKKTTTFYHLHGTHLEERSLYLPLETKDRTTKRLQHVPTHLPHTHLSMNIYMPLKAEGKSSKSNHKAHVTSHFFFPHFH